MIENLPNETWKSHPIYTDYAASNLGRIKSLERDTICSNGKIKHYEEQLIKPYPNEKGYLYFCICNTNLGIKKPFRAHRFIYECMNQMIIPDDLEINHIDCNRSNNQIFNLELLDHQSNVDYSQAKAVGQYNLEGNLIKIWKSLNEARRNGYNQGNISDCCRGKRKTHHNFIWKFIDE